MRHLVHDRKLNRTTAHRKALRRNMAQNLIEHGHLTTTLPKAKNLRPFVERLVSLAVDSRKLAKKDPAASLVARRTIHKLLSDRALIPAEKRADYNQMSDSMRERTMRARTGRRHRSGEPAGKLGFTAESIAHRLIETVALRFEDRPGGYTRIIRLAKTRIGDASPLATIQFVGAEQPPLSTTKPKRSARKRRADARYSLAGKLAKNFVARKKSDESAS